MRNHIQKIILQSANDCPERDPYKVLFYDGENNLLATYDNIVFNKRYQKIEFLVDSKIPVSSILIKIVSNRSLAEKNHWGSGTQLAQVIFLYI